MTILGTVALYDPSLQRLDLAADGAKLIVALSDCLPKPSNAYPQIIIIIRA